jgi:hypothetical protein
VFGTCDMQWHSRARFHTGEARDTAGITAVRNTHCTVYWYTGMNTDLHKGDVKVECVAVVTCMTDYSWNIKNISTGIGVSGAHPHRERGQIRPIDNKITMFILNIKLIEYYIMNCIRILAMNILCVCACVFVCVCVCVCVCVYVCIQDDKWFVTFIVGDEFFGFCNQKVTKTYMGLDSYKVVTASKLEKMIRNLQLLYVKIMNKQITW